MAPGLKALLLGVRGWYSTNILGNRDGEVLDDPESFKTKEESKKSALDYIFQPHLYPDLYKDLCHVVRINYYPPRGDNKEGWDNIDLVGWLGYPMQLKINFLCRDSILAAPIVLDVALTGFLAGIAGAFVYLVISVPIDLTIGPMEREMMRRMVENMGGAENFRNYADRADLVSAPVRAVISFFSMLCLGAVFSTI